VLIEKEIISPGTYWYSDETTGLPRKLVVTAAMTKYWQDQGNKMLSQGLPVPVPYEHDFSAHPMTPKDKLLNNAGEVKEYRLKGDALWSVVDIQDPDVKRKIGHSIRWTSPWINSFTDGSGNKWDNVISHLALTTRPRITKQTPFDSIAAALSMATELPVTSGVEGATPFAPADTGLGGFCLSRAGRILTRKKTDTLQPQYPIAFCLVSGAKFADDDMPPLKDDGEDDVPKKKKNKSKPNQMSSDNIQAGEEEEEETPDITGLMNPLQDQHGDVKMEELLCDLLSALGVQMPDNVGEGQFKRALYEAAMNKIKELTSQAQAQANPAGNAAGNTTSPAGAGAGGQQNPLIQQEQQPMYMSLDDINKITDPTMKSIAMSMYNENVKLRAEAEADRKKLNALNDAKLKEENAKRATRIQMLGKLSPKVKADLDAMVALPAMALSIGDGGAVVDPMASTLTMLEKGLSDLPKLLTTPANQVIAMAQPTDDDMLSQEDTDKLADDMARMMGCPPEQKKAG
jgi:hypothetical protein